MPYRFDIGHTLVLDANVLWYTHLLGVLIYCHHKTILSLKWTDTIVDEAESAMRTDGRHRQAARLRPLLDYAGLGTRVTDHTRHEDGLDLPDATDRHVLAAGIACDADVIVTSNLRDFPDEALAPHGIVAVSPDDLLTAILDHEHAAGALIAACLRQPLPAADLLTRLAEIAPNTAATLRDPLEASPS